MSDKAIESRIRALLPGHIPPLKMSTEIILSCLTQLLSNLIHKCLQKALKGSIKSYGKVPLIRETPCLSYIQQGIRTSPNKSDDCTVGFGCRGFR